MDRLIRSVIRNGKSKKQIMEDYQGKELFSLGYDIARDDMNKTLMDMGYKLNENQMKTLMDAIIFHINR